MIGLCVVGLLLGAAGPSLVPGSPRVLTGHTGTVVAVAFSPDGKSLASTGFDKSVRVWDLATLTQRLELTGPLDNVASVAFSPDGKVLAAGDAGLAITLWSMPEGKLLRVMHNAEPIAGLAFSPDGKLLAAGGISGTGEVFAVADGKELYEVRVRTPSFSKDGKTIAGTTRVGSVLLYDAASGKLKREFKGAAPSACVATGDLKRLYAFSGSEAKVAVLDATTGKSLAPLAEATKGISSVALSIDGTLLAAASEDKVVRIYDLAKGALLRKLPLERVGFVALSADKATLAVGDGVVVKLFGL